MAPPLPLPPPPAPGPPGPAVRYQDAPPLHHGPEILDQSLEVRVEYGVEALPVDEVVADEELVPLPPKLGDFRCRCRCRCLCFCLRS